MAWNSADLDAIWVEGITTLRTWLGTTTPDLSAATYFFELRDSNFASASFTISLNTDSTTTTITTTTTVRPVSLTATLIQSTPISDLGAPSPIASGMSVNLSGTGFTPNAEVEAYLASTPVLLGSTTADASGAALLTVTIPSNFEGNHSLLLFEPVSGLIQRQVVEIANAELPATGASSQPMLTVLAVLALLAGAVLVRRPSPAQR